MEPEGLFHIYKCPLPVPILSIKFITDKNCMYILMFHLYSVRFTHSVDSIFYLITEAFLLLEKYRMYVI
jgi:hypothetical protein